MTKENIILILIVFEILMSFITAIFYKIDKSKAKKGKWRTKEKTLLLLPWLLGGIGGFIGIYVIRHKTNHWYFVLNNFIALVIQFAIFASVIILL